jgi:biopolymer transport protein ExbD
VDAGGVEEDSGGSGSNVFGEAAVPPVSLNLTALMDILSNLLFFLLAAFGATVVMAINATVPVQSADKSDVAATRQTVTAMVTLSDAAIDVIITGTEQTQADLDRFKTRIPAGPNGLDYAAFANHLVAIKQEYPRSDTMILSSAPGTKYETMIKAMDASRETKITLDGIDRLVPLFPTVVVSPAAASKPAASPAPGGGGGGAEQK